MITEHARDRYNAMIDLYGKDQSFAPPLTHDFGVIPALPGAGIPSNRGQVFEMSNEAIAVFSKLNRWRRMGKVPVVVPVK